MARDENNGQGGIADRFYFANSKDQFKKAHRHARVHGLPVFWFNERRVQTSVGYGDTLNQWAYDDCTEFRYMTSTSHTLVGYQEQEY